MAPEQARAGRVGPQTDVWAMGVLLYRALSGRLPFDAPTPEAVMCQVVSIRPPPLRSVCPELSEHVALTIDRALEPAPQLRHAEMRSFARALAIAAQRDGLSLPAAPDPIGLPDFAAWLASADVLTTAPAGAAWSAPAQRRAPASPPLRSRQQRRWLVPAGLLVVAATVAAAAVLARDAPERAPAAAVAAQARQRLVEPMAESLAEPANAPPRSIAPDVAPVDASVSAPSAPRRPPGRDHRRQPSSSERRRGAELIREWDW